MKPQQVEQYQDWIKRNIQTIKPGISFIENNELIILDSVIQELNFIQSMAHHSDQSKSVFECHAAKHSNNFSNISEIQGMNNSDFLKQRFSENNIQNNNNLIRINENKNSFEKEKINFNENDVVFAFTLPKYLSL